MTAALADVHEQLNPYYSEIGRPSVDPELMIRMLIVGYCYGLRSERKLTQEVELHLAYRWFCRLDLDDKVPHHSTFSENRLHRFRESDVFRHIFERVVAACMAAGLVKGEGFAVDASVMEANASRYHGKAPEEIDWTEKQRQKRAVAEYLAALEAEAEADPDRKPPKVISPRTRSAWTAKANKRVQFGYGLNYLIDIENAVIVDVEATPARTYDEVAATKTMLDRTEERFGLKPKRLAADTAYGTGKFLGWLVGEGITPHIPVWEKSDRQDGTSHARTSAGTGSEGSTSAPTASCSGPAAPCTTDARCSIAPPSAIAMCARSKRSAAPSNAQGKSRAIFTRMPAMSRGGRWGQRRSARSRDERKRVEMRFAHLKTHHGFERMRLRGLSGARDEFHLAAIVQNLKTLALRALGPPPQPTARSVCLRVGADQGSLKGNRPPDLTSIERQTRRPTKRRLFRQHRPQADFGPLIAAH